MDIGSIVSNWEHEYCALFSALSCSGCPPTLASLFLCVRNERAGSGALWVGKKLARTVWPAGTFHDRFQD